MSNRGFIDRAAQRAGGDTVKAAHEVRTVVEVVGEATQTH
jgi:hypothetical protein